MISPAMRAIRRQFPQAVITLLAKPWVLDALRGCPFFDRLIEYDRESLHAGLSGRLRLIRFLRRERFDLAFLFQKAFEAAFLARVAGIPVRIGFKTDRRGWLLSEPLEEPAHGHHVEHFLRIAEAAGCDIADRRLSFSLDPVASDRARAFLMKNRIDAVSLRVAFHPGASKAPRGWHPERFAEVASCLVRDYNICPLLLGSESDRPTLRGMADRIGPSAILPPPGQTLGEMAALLERCHLLVCNDSGPMHIAAALRVPLVSVFGPGAPGRTAPYTDPSLYRVISENYPCSPCRQKFFHECIPAISKKPYCLEDVRAEVVLDACRDLLAAQGFPVTVQSPVPGDGSA